MSDYKLFSGIAVKQLDTVTYVHTHVSLSFKEVDDIAPGHLDKLLTIMM